MVQLQFYFVTKRKGKWRFQELLDMKNLKVKVKSFVFHGNVIDLKEWILMLTLWHCNIEIESLLTVS